MAGIIQSAVDPVKLDPLAAQTTDTTANTSTNTTPTGSQTATTATVPGVAGYNPTNVASPTTWDVNDKQTVAGQVKSVIDDNSPIIQQARTNAKMAANDRGLLNSSMAVQAGENAAYAAALPIAQADAATEAKAAGYNADQINQTHLQDANYANTAAQFNANAMNTRSNAQADNIYKTQLQQLNNDNQTLIQSNSQAAKLMSDANGMIDHITQNNQMSAAAKTEASRQVYENLRQQMAILAKTSGLDLTSLLKNPYA